jgi:hypothetical protein
LPRLFLVAGVSAATLAASPAASQREMSPPDARKDVWGNRIDAICSRTFSARRLRSASVRAIRRWPTGQMELRYLWRNAGSERWLRRVGGILVDRGVISIATDLRHAIVGEEDAVLRVCRQRE